MSMSKTALKAPTYREWLWSRITERDRSVAWALAAIAAGGKPNAFGVESLDDLKVVHAANVWAQSPKTPEQRLLLAARVTMLIVARWRDRRDAVRVEMIADAVIIYGTHGVGGIKECLDQPKFWAGCLKWAKEVHARSN